MLIFEKMFENRLFFVDKLVNLGRADHPLRSAPGDRERPGEALRRADGEPGHPRRHGDAHRRASAPRARPRSGTSGRSTAATSASTSACARSARASSASSRSWSIGWPCARADRSIWCGPPCPVSSHPTERAPAPFQGAPYSQGIVFGDLVFVAGQLGIDPETIRDLDGGIEEQTEQVMKNIRAILEEAGSSTKQLLKCTIFLADFDDFAAVNEVYAQARRQRRRRRARRCRSGAPQRRAGRDRRDRAHLGRTGGRSGRD